MLRAWAFACLVAGGSSFRPLGRGGAATRPPSHAARPLSRGPRLGAPLAQLARGAGRPRRATTALAAVWEPQVDEASGQTYYLNSQTGESQWEAPESTTVRRATTPSATATTPRWRIDGLSGVAGFSGVPGFSADNKYADGGFRMERAREGRPCQLPYLVGAGEEKMLSRWNMLEQKQNVAQDQCVVRSTFDGTATLVSLGEAPTLWRATGGAWSALYQGQEQVLSEGDQVGLDCDDPEGAVFVCNFGYWSWTGSRLDGPTVSTASAAGGQSCVQAFSDYAPQQEGELGFRAGDVIQVTQQGEAGGWWEGTLNGQAGYFPSNFCSEPKS